MSRALEPESPAARAAARIVEKRRATPKEAPAAEASPAAADQSGPAPRKEDGMPKGVKGSRMSEEEAKAKKAERNRQYWLRKKGGAPAKPRKASVPIRRAPAVAAPTATGCLSLRSALDLLVAERAELDKLIAFLERRITGS